MTPFFDRLIGENQLAQPLVYAEPYAGGAGTAINLLLSRKVQTIRINDAAIGIYSFWNSVVMEGERFLQTLWDTPVNLHEWQRQRKIFKSATCPSFELGFATFYLSRTNRSGILRAGPMGGQDEVQQQNATYKIDCRFNKVDLSNRIKRILELKSFIHVSNLDAIDFLKSVNDEHALVYLDPPYYEQGEALYLNYYQHEDHVRLSSFLRHSSKFDWVLSYDNVPAILEMYSDFPLYQFALKYTAQEVKAGSELLTHSPGLCFPNSLVFKKRDRTISILGII